MANVFFGASAHHIALNMRRTEAVRELIKQKRRMPGIHDVVVWATDGTPVLLCTAGELRSFAKVNTVTPAVQSLLSRLEQIDPDQVGREFDPDKEDEEDEEDAKQQPEARPASSSAPEPQGGNGNGLKNNPSAQSDTTESDTKPNNAPSSSDATDGSTAEGGDAASVHSPDAAGESPSQSTDSGSNQRGDASPSPSVPNRNGVPTAARGDASTRTEAIGDDVLVDTSKPAAVEGRRDNASTESESRYTGVPFADADSGTVATTPETTSEQEINMRFNPFAAQPHVSSLSGGVTAQWREAKPDGALIRQARRAFRRLVRGGETAPGPRFDTMAVSTKIAGYLRLPTNHDRRMEDGRPSILVLSDISGSMSGISQDLLALCVALQKTGVPGADVFAVSHVNGVPHAEFRRGQATYFPPLTTSVTMTYLRMMQQRNVRIVVCLGDSDAEAIYLNLAESVRVVWLDNTACRKLPRPMIDRFGGKHPNLQHWIGVKDIAAFVATLEKVA